MGQREGGRGVVSYGAEGGRGVVSYGAEGGREGCCELWGRGREGGVL